MLRRSGGQVVPPDDHGIIECVKAASDREIPEKPLDEALAGGSIVEVLRGARCRLHHGRVSESVSHARDLSIVYTPLHGVGETSVAASARDRRLFASPHPRVAAQPDGDFPNVPDHVANPEYPRTLEAAIAEARDTGADLVLASDPDADRIGVGVPVTRDPQGEWTTLDGNQIGVLLAAFVMKECEARGQLRARPLSGHDPGLDPDGPRPGRSRGRSHRGRPARRLQVDRQADRRGGPARLPVRVRGVARLLEGDPRPRQGRGRRRPALRRAGRRPSRTASRPSSNTSTTSTSTSATTATGSSTRLLEGREGLAKIKRLMEAFCEPTPRGSSAG